MKILAIDTSCDETSAAITCGREVVSHVEYMQVLIHKQWGGVVPSLAKRAHEERIDFVIKETLARGRGAHKNFTNIDYIAVTQGPGLAIALEVGIRKAKELAQNYNKKLIAVDHMEGHIYSCFAQNSKGNPKRNFVFPSLALLVSGKHTQLVLFKNHIEYDILGQTLDDAAGEALDKAARMLGFSYPGGPVIEKLADEVNNAEIYKFPRPMIRSKYLDFSFSGLKTSFLYYLKELDDQERLKQIRYLASSFQEAVFDSLIHKTERAINNTNIRNLIVGGGISINRRFRYLVRSLIKKHKGTVYFPPYTFLTGDNAAMIGVAAYYKAQKDMFLGNIYELDRVPRLSLG